MHHLIGGEKRVELLLLRSALLLHVLVELGHVGRHYEALGGVEPKPDRGKTKKQRTEAKEEGEMGAVDVNISRQRRENKNET